MDRKKVILLLSVCVLSVLGVLGTIILFIYMEDKNKIVKVRGSTVEFNASDARLELDDFDQIEIGMSMKEMVNIIGEPDEWIGNYSLLPFYYLKEGKVVLCEFEFRNTSRYLIMLEVYENDKSYIYKE